MTSDGIEISVVIPCWNVAPWLGRCLDSVFAALPAAAEAIAVDDGSDDSTLDILRERAAREPRLRVLALGHRGVSAARNAALDAAGGKTVFFVDPDDQVAPDFFSAMSEALSRDGADVCVCAFSGAPLKGDYRFGSGEGIRAGYLPRVFGYSFDDVRAWYAGKPLFADREMASACRMAFRRELLDGIRFDETIELYEDAMFVSEALLRAKSMTCVDRELYTVTDRESGAMRSIPKNGARLCRNKLRLLAKRRALDEAEGGSLGPLYAASCVFSALEMLSATVRGRLPRREGIAYLREYLADGFVQRSLKSFPISWRRPVVACAVLALRVAVR
jgi:glycosyltransferase involved in cell wall biosynthesis